MEDNAEVQATLDTSGGIESVNAMDTTIADAWKDISKDLHAPAENVARDTTGRFAAKEPVQESAAQEVPAAPKPTEPAAPEVPESQPVVEAKKAPASWKKEAAEAFNALPPHVQDEVLRREGDFHKGIEGYKQAAETGRKFEQAVSPYLSTIQKLGVSPEVAVAALMKADHTLRFAPPAVKAQYFQDLAKNYGIDLGQQFDPNVAAMQQRIYELEQTQTTLQSSNEQREIAQLTSEVESFAHGKEHFGAVQAEMLALLPMFKAQNPQASNQEVLQMAYDRAVYANPQTRGVVLAKQQEEQRAEAQRKANEAKKAASVNVQARGTVAHATPKLSWEDQIRADAVRLGLAH